MREALQHEAGAAAYLAEALCRGKMAPHRPSDESPALREPEMAWLAARHPGEFLDRHRHSDDPSEWPQQADGGRRVDFTPPKSTWREPGAAHTAQGRCRRRSASDKACCRRDRHERNNHRVCYFNLIPSARFSRNDACLSFQDLLLSIVAITAFKRTVSACS